MSGPKLSPGPWTFDPGGRDECGVLWNPGGIVCEFIEDPTLDDGRLICAAPDLLAALQVLLRDVQAVDAVGQFGPELAPGIYQAVRAVSKATGGQA